MGVTQCQILRPNLCGASGNRTEDAILIELLIAQVIGSIQEVTFRKLMVETNVSLVVVIPARLIGHVVVDDLIGNRWQRSDCQHLHCHGIEAILRDDVSRKGTAHPVN